MKLLTPQATLDTANSEQARGLLRLQALTEAEKELRIKLANTEADFNERLVRNRKIWEAEEEAHRKRIGEMEDELRVEGDIKAVDKESKTAIAEANLILAKAKDQSAHNEEVASLLEDKLDDVGEREQTVSRREREFESMRAGFNLQKESLVAQTSALTEAMAKFTADKSLWDSDVKKRNEQLILRERSIDGWESSLKKKQEDVALKELSLADKEKQLDERDSVAYEPIKQKEAELEKQLLEVIETKKNLSEREATINKRELESASVIATQKRELKDNMIKFQKEREILTNEESLLDEAKKKYTSEYDAFMEQRRTDEQRRTELEEYADKVKREAEEFQKEKETTLEEVNEVRASFDKQREDLALREASIHEKLEQVERDSDYIKTGEKKVREGLNKLDNERKEFNLEREEFAQKSEKFKAEYSDFVSIKVATENRLGAEVAKIRIRERDIAAKEQKISRQEKFLSDWAIRLKDMEGSLMRAKREVG